MSVNISELKARIDKATTRRAALDERKRSATADLAEAEAGLTALGLTPKDAQKKIEALEAKVLAELEAVEEQLGIA